MKKIFSAKYSAGAFNAAMLFLRLGVGILMMHTGYYKLTHFSGMLPNFGGYFGMSNTVALSLVVFAEFFCSMFLILGLFTRLATIPLIITMCVVVFKVNHGNVFNDTSLPALFLLSYLVLLLVGPGRVSVDSMIGK